MFLLKPRVVLISNYHHELIKQQHVELCTNSPHQPRVQVTAAANSSSGRGWGLVLGLLQVRWSDGPEALSSMCWFQTVASKTSVQWTGSEQECSVVCALVLCGKVRMFCGLQVRAGCSGSPRSRTTTGSEVIQHLDRSVSPVWFVICCSEPPSSVHLVLPGESSSSGRGSPLQLL
ncbi:hypothetical protein NL108_017850 [Boleophthalmus pectinirostris]|nr:hypothetical protein NL108_017850 [Boleophthalmus pectinirostris]